MNDRVQTISFRTRRQKHDERRARREAGLRKTHPARVARLLAQAHDLEARVQAGEFRDRADVARRLGLTQARLTQLVVTLLASEIQIQLGFATRSGRRHRAHDRTSATRGGVCRKLGGAAGGLDEADGVASRLGACVRRRSGGF